MPDLRAARPLWASLLALPGCTLVVVDDPCAPIAVAVAAGGLFDCVIDGQGAVACWGNDARGQVSGAPAGTGFVAIDAGYEHACAIDEAGAVTCWGRDLEGQLTPPTGLGPVRAITAGAVHTCALDEAGLVACWGLPEAGLDFPGGEWASITAGWTHSCALDADGNGACWGQDIGDPPPGASVVSAGQSHDCAIVDGGITCWGLGLAMSEDPPAGSWIDVRAGTDSSCALDAAGGITCWGADTIGQTDAPDGVFAVLDLGTGGQHGCAVGEHDGAGGPVTCWGLDSDGQGSTP